MGDLPLEGDNDVDLGAVAKGQCVKCFGWGQYARQCPSQDQQGKGGKGKKKKKFVKWNNDNGKRHRYWDGAKASWQKQQYSKKGKWG